jgi:hypothetical protein
MGAYVPGQKSFANPFGSTIDDKHPGAADQAARSEFDTLLGQAPKEDQTDLFLKALNSSQFGSLGKGRKSSFNQTGSDTLAPPTVGSKTLLGG